MACNIHTRAEQRVDGKWRVIPGLMSFRRSHYCPKRALLAIPH
jgi:hypothetical protein